MNDNPVETDDMILKRLREPIDELVNRHCFNMSLESRLVLKQLAWYAVDILIDTDDVENLKNNDVICKLIEEIKSLSGSQEFINESLELTKRIYKNIQLDYPELLTRYRFKKNIT